MYNLNCPMLTHIKCLDSSPSHSKTYEQTATHFSFAPSALGMTVGYYASYLAISSARFTSATRSTSTKQKLQSFETAGMASTRSRGLGQYYERSLSSRSLGGVTSPNVVWKRLVCATKVSSLRMAFRSLSSSFSVRLRVPRDFLKMLRGRMKAGHSSM